MAANPNHFLDSEPYAVMARFARILTLGTIWTVASLPLVTLAPATAAMFAVVRGWQQEREDPICRSFARAFVANCRQAIAVQLLATVICIGLLVNLQVASALPPAFRMSLQLVTLCCGPVVLAAAAYVFPLMVTYRMGAASLLRWSVLLGLGGPGTTLRCIALAVVAVALTYVFPLAPLLCVGVIANQIYRWCRHRFVVIEAGKEVRA